MYATDLAYIHDAGFGILARDAAPELIRLLRRYGIAPAMRRPVRARARPRPAGPRARIVEVGCGSGILAEALVDAGYTLTGFDASPAMIRLARARVADAVFRAGSIATLRLPPCDAVIATGEVFNYVPSWRTVRRFFVQAHQALSHGGLFIFDFLESAARRTYGTKRFAGDDWMLLVSADLDDSGRVLTRRITSFRKIGRKCRRAREVHRVHLYARSTVASALAQAGFAVDLRQSYGRRRLMPGDVTVIARRR